MSELSWKKELIEVVTGDISRLADVWRYSSIPATFRENTPEHQGWVTIYAILIHQILKPEDLILLGPVTTHAATHDLAESVTGDVVRTFKYSDPDLRAKINEAEMKIIKNFPISVQKSIGLHVLQLKALDRMNEVQYVEDVVKMADFMSLWMFMRREVRRGNRDMYPYFNRMINDFKSMKDTMSNRTMKAKTDEEIRIIKHMVGFYYTLSLYDDPKIIP